jgi:hypothetical protein
MVRGVAEAFGHVEGPELAVAYALADRVLTMLWRLTHGGGSDRCNSALPPGPARP